jgi:tetratricopeptide (TPR) repeat protein
LEAQAAKRWAIPIIVALGVALRVAHLAWLHASPFAGSLILDARFYDAWAQRIAGGEWIGRSAFWVDPLYAYLLAAIYRLAGHDLLLPRLANVAFGAGTAIVAARIAWRLWDSRSAAALAALMVVLFIPEIHFETQIEKTALSVFLLALCVDLFLAGTMRAIFAAGIAVGLATLARGNALLLLPFAALALTLGWDSERGGVADRRVRLQRAGLLLAGALPLIGLATLHNYEASGELVPTTTNLGINLYLGNHLGNIYGYYEPPDFLHPSTDTEAHDFRAEAERRTGRTFSDRALSSYWVGQSWQAVVARPELALRRTIHKLQLIFNDDEVPDSDDVALVAQWSPVLRSPIVWFGELLPLALLGIAVGWRRRSVRVVAAAAAVYVASLLPFFVFGRLRVQLLPFLAVLASGALLWLIAALRARRGRSLSLAVLILAVGSAAAFYRPEWMARRRTSSLAIGWYNLGASLTDRGRSDEAIRAYENAVRVDAKSVPAALRVLGRLYEQRGDYVRAEGAMRKVLELRPESPSARNALRTLYDTMLADPRWRDDDGIRRRRAALGGTTQASAVPDRSDTVRSVFAQVHALRAAGRFDEAIAVLQRAVTEGPYNEDMHYMLGQLMERYSSPEAMVEFFSREVGHDQKPQTSHYFWALGLAREGDVDGAIAQLRQALEIDPAHEMSQWQWGLLLERQGHPEQALEHIEEAVRILPDFKAALLDAARVAKQLGRSDQAREYEDRAANADSGSVRRFLYWARYLQQHGRSKQARAEVERYLAQRPNDPEGLALREQIFSSLGEVPPAPATAVPDENEGATAASLSAASRAALLSTLSTQSPGSPTWIAYDGRDPSALALAKQLAAVFEAAGWKVRKLAEASFSVRPGLFLLQADDPPSAAASTVEKALDAAQLQPTVGAGYRAYAEGRRRADSTWRGFDLASDQDFVLVVGRRNKAARN